MESCAQGCVLYKADDSLVKLNINTISGHLSRVLLLSQLAELNALNFRLNEPAIETAIKLSLGTITPSHTLLDQPELIIAERTDAAVSVEIADDAMLATLTVLAPCGGEPLSVDQLLRALKGCAVIKGISKAQLQRLFIESQSLGPGESISLPVASGKPAVHGLDSLFERLVEDVAARVLQPRTKQDGSVDMRDLGDVITVKASEPLMRRTEPTMGMDGFTVDGSVLAANPGHVVPFAEGLGTVVSDDDPDLLVASLTGMPVFTDNGCRVDQLLTLDGVNVTTGHIEFDGSVLVNGDVAAGMRVVATGTISVTGFVECAELQAGSDILVQNGIIGRQHELNDLDCIVCAGGSIASRFAQYADINAGKNATFTLHALHCHITVGKDLEVMDFLKRQGTLSGGMIHAGRSIRVVSIGAVAGVPTSITVLKNGIDLRGELARISGALLREADNADKTKMLDQKLAKLPEARRPLELVEHVSRALESHQHCLAKLQHEYDMALQQYQSMRSLAAIRVYRHLFHRVSVRIDEQQMVVSEGVGAVSIKLGEQALHLQTR